MRLMLALTVLPLPALAHTGHLGEVAGHDHWVAGAAIGVAVGIGAWQALKDRRARRAAGTPVAAEGGEAAEEQSA